jgi:prolyl oligopeptidase
MRPALLSLAALLAMPITASAADDPHLWLEAVEDEKALAWVREQNVDSVDELSRSGDFKRIQSRVREILDSDARIPFVGKMGEHYYNFWRDAKNPRGLWRRTSLDEYRKAEPAWEVVLDLDELAKAEGENWVWAGANCLEPEYRKCLLGLSRGGADANVTREFDTVEKRFVEGGFALPEAKSSVSWIDADTLFVGTDFGQGSMTDSGYPRVAKRWQRGTPLAQAEMVYEGQSSDVWIAAFADTTPGFERQMVYRGITFYTNEVHLVRDGKLVRIDKQDSANFNLHRRVADAGAARGLDCRRQDLAGRRAAGDEARGLPCRRA